MADEYRFRVDADWTQDRQGKVRGHSGAPELNFSAPPEFHGVGGIWSPEDFFLAAVATCFITTFRAIAEFSKFNFEVLRVSSEGLVNKQEGGYKFSRVVVRPILTIELEQDRDRALRLLEKAERSCLVSRSLQSELVLEPLVEIRQPVGRQ
jgi:peroxiredoxin-like protein